MELRWPLDVLLASLTLFSLRSSVEGLQIKVYKDEELLKSYSNPNAEYNGHSYNVPKKTLMGVLVYSNPKNACRMVQPVPVVNDTKIFAFIEEYFSCPGRSEINLNDAHYDAMIAYSPRIGLTLKDSSVSMPEVLLEDRDFFDFLKGNAITNDTSDLNPNTTVYIHLLNDSFNLELLFIIFGVILLSALLLSIFVFCCSVCWRVLVVKWRNRGLTRWQVRRLPKRKYRRSKDAGCETCSICLEEFKEGVTVRVLPCDHVFHPKCVDVWLQKWNRTCPLCKSAIKRQGKPLFTEDQESSHLLSDGAEASAHLNEGEDEPDGRGSRATTGGGASNYGATEQRSPLRLIAAGSHRRSASSASTTSRRSSALSRSNSRREPAVTTIELNVTSSDETSRSVTRSPSPDDSPAAQFHTPHNSDGDNDDEANPSFKTANGESSVASSVRV